MSDQTNLFNSPNPTPVADQQQQAPVQDPLQDLLGSIRNEQGQPKYKDVPSALEGLRHAQGFIETLKNEKLTQDAELQRLRAELEKRTSVEDIVNRLAPNQGNAATTNTDSLTPDKIAEMVTNQLASLQTQTTKDQNLKSVNSALIERFGDKAGDMLKAKAQELGVTVKQLGELAQQSPKAVLAYFPSTQQHQGSSPSLNTTNFQEAPVPTELPAPSKSLLSGASSRDQAAYMKEIREFVHKKYGVTQS